MDDDTTTTPLGDEAPAAEPAPGDTTPAPAVDRATPDPGDATPPLVEGAQPAQPGPGPGRHPVLVYTGLRIAVLAAVGGVLYLVGLRGIYLILFAFLVSGVISAFVLSRIRESAAYGITSVVRGIGDRIDASTRAEDVDDSADFDERPGS